jgi:hypothetical protein
VSKTAALPLGYTPKVYRPGQKPKFKELSYAKNNPRTTPSKEENNDVS